MLSVSGLSKRYGPLLAVDDISITVEHGELFSIVGPSGSGKSTLLRCIAGLERPDEGTVAISGTDITEQSPYERNTSMVFQNLALFPHMSVAENVAYGMKRHGVEKDVRAERVEDYLRLVDLTGYGDREIHQLSGGEQQRVALARSLAVRPKVLLLDEPLASLDQQLRIQLQDELVEVQQELDQTAIYVTHDQNVAFSISDRVALLNGGTVEQVGTPQELYEDPQTSFVAEFIGISNSVEGTVDAVENGELTFQPDGADQLLRGRAVDAVDPGDRVRSVVKLENFVLDPPDEHPNQLDGDVDRIAYRGNDVKLRIAVNDGFRIEALTNAVHDFSVGERVSVGWQASDAPTFEVR